MRKWLLLLVGVLLLGSVGLAAEEETAVLWQIDSCWITLQVHKQVDLGLVSGPWNPGDYIEDIDGNRIEISTNCSEWYLKVSRDWTPPTGYSGDGLTDFYTWVVADGGDPHTIGDGWGSPNNGDGEIATGGPGSHWFDMGYRYMLDPDDIPGAYKVTLTYTVTTP